MAFFIGNAAAEDVEYRLNEMTAHGWCFVMSAQRPIARTRLWRNDRHQDIVFRAFSSQTATCSDIPRGKSRLVTPQRGKAGAERRL